MSNDTARIPKRIFPHSTPHKNVITLSNVDTLLEDALGLVEQELLKLRIKSNKGQSLSATEATTLNGYIKSLVNLARETRERDKHFDASKLTDAELVELAKQLLAPKRETLPAVKTESKNDNPES